MAQTVPLEGAGDAEAAGGRTEETADLTVLAAVHRGLRRDLSRFVDTVGTTAVTDRSTWAALHTRWDFFAVIVRRCLTWERDHLWSLLAAAPSSQVSLPEQLTAALVGAPARADVAMLMIDSCGPVLGRLATARDEDAFATVRARVRAACTVLEETLDGEEIELFGLFADTVSPRLWRRAQRQLFDVDTGDLGGEGLAWLVHELPLEMASGVAAVWNTAAQDPPPADSAAFRRMEAAAFGREDGPALQ